MLTCLVKMTISGIFTDVIDHGWIAGSAWSNDIVRSFGSPDLNGPLFFGRVKYESRPVGAFLMPLSIRREFNQVGNFAKS